ncbi:hypothetical protein L6232_23100, partial [Shewanella sp. C31]|nr:hypothetical protein [Shewanella electrica]
ILERIKLRAALPLVAGLLEEGWHVLLFVQYRSDKTLDLTSPEAVEAFLQGRLPFPRIPEILAGVLEATPPLPLTWENLFAADAWAREVAMRWA